MAKKKTKTITISAREVSIDDVPLGDAKITHKSVVVSVGQLTIEQRAAYVALMEGCRLTCKTLANGKVVNNGSDAIRWLLEQIPVETTQKNQERWAKVA